MSNYITAIEWANGHTGAMGFLTMLNRQDEDTIQIITDALLVATAVRGKRLHNLWVLADHDFHTLRKICEKNNAKQLERMSLNIVSNELYEESKN